MKSSSTTSVRSDSTEETSQPSSSGSGSASGLTVASNMMMISQVLTQFHGNQQLNYYHIQQ